MSEDIKPKVVNIYNLLKGEKRRRLAKTGRKFIKAYESGDRNTLEMLIESSKPFLKIDYNKINKEMFQSDDTREVFIDKLVEITKDDKNIIDSRFSKLIKDGKEGYKLSKREKEFISAYVSMDERKIAIASWNLNMSRTKEQKKKSGIRMKIENYLGKFLADDYYG